jgi:hypothetical protein
MCVSMYIDIYVHKMHMCIKREDRASLLCLYIINSTPKKIFKHHIFKKNNYFSGKNVD